MMIETEPTDEECERKRFHNLFQFVCMLASTFRCELDFFRISLHDRRKTYFCVSSRYIRIEYVISIYRRDTIRDSIQSLSFKIN